MMDRGGKWRGRKPGIWQRERQESGELESWTDTERARAAPEPVRMEEVEEGGLQTGPVRASQDTWGQHRLEGRSLTADNMLLLLLFFKGFAFKHRIFLWNPKQTH